MAYAGDLAADSIATLLERVTVQDGFVRRERDDGTGCLHAEGSRKGGEGEVAVAQVDVEEVNAGIFDLGERGQCVNFVRSSTVLNSLLPLRI